MNRLIFIWPEFVCRSYPSRRFRLLSGLGSQFCRTGIFLFFKSKEEAIHLA